MLILPSIRSCICKANSIVFFRCLLLLTQELLSRLLAFSLLKVEGVQSVYCAGSMARRDYQPGESDIDLIVLTKNCSLEEEIILINKISIRFKRLNFIFKIGSLLYILSPQDIRIIEQISGFVYIFNPAQWRLLSGKKAAHLPLNLQVPANNFGFLLNAKIWHDTMLEYYYARDPRNKTTEIRKFYSTAFKICRLIAYARREAFAANIFDPAPYSFLNEINDDYLQKKCKEVQKQQWGVCLDKNTEFHIAEICARTIKYLDSEAHKYFKEQGGHSENRIFERPSLPLNRIDPPVQKLFTKNLSMLYKNIDLIIHHQSTYHMFLKTSLSAEEIRQTLVFLKQNQNNLPLPDRFIVSTPHIFYLGITSDPIGYSSFLRDSQIYTQEAGKEKMFIAATRPEKIFINFSRCIFAKNSAFLLQGEQRIAKLKFVLTGLMQCRLFFEKGELAFQGDEVEKYRQGYGKEAATASMCTLFQSKWPPASSQEAKEQERRLWASCNYLANKAMPKYSSKWQSPKAQ